MKTRKNILARILIVLLAISGLALVLAACGSSSSTFLPPPPPAPLTLGDIEAKFANGTSWNDYVKGGNIINATDIACDADTDTACVHAGEVRVVEVSGTASCAGVTAADTLGAFDWICDDSSDPVVLISNGLASGSGLQDLIDFAALAWKDNSVTVYRDGTQEDITNSAAWWDNPVIANTLGGDLDSEGTVYVIGNIADGKAYNLIANSVSLVAAPGVIINGPGTNNVVIEALGRDYLWVEGMVINGLNDNIGVTFDTVRFSTLRDLTSDKSGIGIYLDAASHNRLSGVITNSNTSAGVYLNASTDNTLTGIIANDSSSLGVSLEASSSNNTLIDITANNNTDHGVYLYTSSDNNTLREVTANDNEQYGVYLSSSSNNTLSGVTASNNTNRGVYLNYSSDNTLTGVTASNNAEAGVYLYSSDYNTLSDLTANSNNDSGVYLDDSSNNTLSGVIASNNGDNGVYIYDYAENNTLSDVTASNNALQGIYIEYYCSDNILSGVTASNNGDNGVYIYESSEDNILSSVTANNNTYYGVYIVYDSGYNALSGVVASNNWSGVYLDSSSYTTLSGVVASNNVYSGIYLDSSSYNHFTGPLKVGNNENSNCSVGSGAEPGLVDGTCTLDGNTGTFDYGLGNSSDALLTNSVIVNASSFFVAKVTTDDSVNMSDDSGTKLYESITDWSGFENPYRSWGIWNADAFPSDTHQGECVTGHLCQIWDWSLLNTDTVIKDALTLPTGDDTLTHNWSGGGSSTFLRNAMEILGDSIGDDDLLCETDETCLYTPNMGSYQGHGAMIVNSTLDMSGAIKNVTLMEYETNGY